MQTLSILRRDGADRRRIENQDPTGQLVRQFHLRFKDLLLGSLLHESDRKCRRDNRESTGGIGTRDHHQSSHVHRDDRIHIFRR